MSIQANSKIFIILLNWNNWNETRECLESLRKVTYDNFETIIVDNGSEEEEREKIKSAHTIYNDTNLGFAGGNNVGIRYSLEHGADYIMLLNNDAIVAPDFLTELVKAAESDPSYGILGSKIYKYGTNDVVFNGGKVNRWLTKGEHIKNQELGIMNHEVDYITGAAMLIKREVVEMVGQMREEYFLYYEDVDWCLRACKAGYKCVLVPASKVWHKVSATNKEGSPSYIYYHTRNGLMLAKFNGNIFQKATSYFIGAWILFKQIPKFFLIPSKRLWVTSMTRGVLDFYKGEYGRYEDRD